ncbi:MAG: BrnT family toxin [Chitinivibrionia bacterium]|nr:BrnT family toxin [Chitinivibrionia bacterium]
MDKIRFAWDENKNQKNIASHGISFKEAETVFYDPNAKLIYDPDHSTEEDRFILLGLSKVLKMLIVCHSYRENDELVRIISARKATTNEKKQYGGKK